MNVPQTMVDVPIYAATQWAPLPAAADLAMCLVAMERVAVVSIFY